MGMSCTDSERLVAVTVISSRPSACAVIAPVPAIAAETAIAMLVRQGVSSS